MGWEILVAISVVTYSVSVLLQRLLLKNDKSDPVAYSIVFQLLTGSLIGLYALFNGFKLPNLVPFIPHLILMVVLYGIANVLIFKSLKVIEASEFTVIFASRVIWTIMGAILFLNESFSPQMVLGTFLIVCSVILVTQRERKLSLNKGFIFPIIAAATFGLAFVNDAYLLKYFDAPSYITLAFILPALAVWAVYPKSASRMKPLLEKKTLAKLCLLSIIYAVSAVTIFLAYQVGRNAAQIAPLNQTATILTVILSVIFLHERTDLLKKMVGAIVSFVGVILVK